MGALRTCCGYYCASVSLVGVYFFIMMAIMEFRGNTYIIQVLQRTGCESDWYNEETSLCCKESWYDALSDADKSAKGKTGCADTDAERENPRQPDPKSKGIAFLIFAAIEVALVFGCYLCGQ